MRVALAGPSPAAPETFEYERIAANLLAGRGYVLDHYGTEYRGYSNGLLYTLLTTGAHHLGAAALMPLLQYLIAAATTLVVLSLARRLADVRGAWLAAMVTALHPALVYYDVYKRHPLGLDTLLFMGVIASLLSSPTTTSAARTGLVLGLGLLERLTLAPMLVIAPAFLLSGAAGKDKARRLAAFGAAVAAVVAPWLVRNARVFGAPIPSTMTGEYLYVGNVPPSLGSYHLPSGALVLDAAPPEIRARLERLDETGQARLFRQAALDFIRREPVRFAAAVVRKIVHFWSWAPQTGVLYPSAYRRVYLPLYALLLVLAVLGAVRAARGTTESRRTLAAMAALAAVVSGQHGLLVVELRHRWTVEPLLIVLAATCVLPREARGRRSAGTGRRSDAGGPR